MREVFEYEKNKAYHENEVIDEIIKNYYNISMNALIEYIKNNIKNPSEKVWNRYAVQNKCLSSKSIAYITNKKFYIICKEIRRNIKEEKKN